MRLSALATLRRDREQFSNMIHINLQHVKTSGYVIRKKDILIIIQYYNIIHETYCMIPNDHNHIKKSMYIHTEMTKEICVKYIVNGEIPI
jgi:hypothetical protein